ncbi:hypothetical protein NPIL_624971 [Nephila pilipes]|uniref:Uncharacterized protein n=1 Tax=Nephila pilipes TaxID=299642 RepID=A0A8X6N944_NEPPI|nr:hypothetical protein NPIL_624971 [Nephila pilipes]
MSKEKTNNGKDSEEKMSNEMTRDMDSLFDSYCKFCNKGPDKMSIDNAKKWFSQAGLISKEYGIEGSDVEKAFEETAKDETELTKSQFEGMVGVIADRKNKTKIELMDKLVLAGEPRICNVTDLINKIC